MCYCLEGVDAVCELILVANLDAIYLSEEKMLLLLRVLGCNNSRTQVDKFCWGTVWLLEELYEVKGRIFQSHSSLMPSSAHLQQLVVFKRPSWMRMRTFLKAPPNKHFSPGFFEVAVNCWLLTQNQQREHQATMVRKWWDQKVAPLPGQDVTCLIWSVQYEHHLSRCNQDFSGTRE